MDSFDDLEVDPSNIHVVRRLYQGSLYSLSNAVDVSTNEKFLLNKPSRNNSRSTTEGFKSALKKFNGFSDGFVLPVAGISSRKPFFFLIPYRGTSSLKAALRNPNNLTPSQRTAIAISITLCVKYIHSRREVLPSLTTDIIYIASRSTARINITEADQRGIPPWHAPEVQSIEDCSRESDVFLLGFIFYELLTGKVAFQNSTEEQIERNIQAHLRPSLSAYKDAKPLVTLIQRCWLHDPVNRPKIEEISAAFEKPETFFPGSNEREVSKLTGMQFNDFPKSVRSSRAEKVENTSIYDLSLIEKTPKKSVIDEKLSVFIDYKNEGFDTSLEDICKIITEIDVINFYTIISHHLRRGVPIAVQCNIIKAINSTLINFKCFEEFQQSNILVSLPYDETEAINDIYELLYTIFLEGQSIINADFKRTMVFLARKSPKKAIVLFANYFKQIGYSETSEHVVESLLACNKVFYRTEAGKEYITTLFFLCFNSEAFFNKHIDECRNIFCTYMHAEDTEVAKAAYYAVFTLLDSEFQLPFQQIISDVSDEEISESAISILLKLTNFPMPQELVDSLLEICSDRKDAFLLLLRIADTCEGAKCVISNASWLIDESIKTMNRLKLLMVILKHNELRDDVSALKQLPKFFSQLVSSKDMQAKVCFVVAIKRITITKELLNKLTDCGFFTALLDAIVNRENDKIGRHLIDVVTYLSKNGYTSGLEDFVKPFVGLINESEPLCKVAFTALIYLSFHEKCAEEMRKADLDIILEDISPNTLPEDQIATILSNIQ